MLARRLSNAEYNYTIRDLTGVDIRPTREFPVDPANPAGFDNSGESLAMSPALLKKYLQAAREVANHLVLESEGLAFAPHPMLVETDRDKYCVQADRRLLPAAEHRSRRLLPGGLALPHRAALGKPRATLASLAADAPGQPASTWPRSGGRWSRREHAVGPMARLQAMWRELPAPGDGRRPPTPSELVEPGVRPCATSW